MFSLFFMLYIVYSHTFTNKRNLASPFETFTTIIQKVVRKSKWVEIKILETSSRSRKTAMSKPLLIKLQASVLPLYWKRHSDAGVSVFFVNFAKFLSTAFFIEQPRWLLLYVSSLSKVFISYLNSKFVFPHIFIMYIVY